MASEKRVSAAAKRVSAREADVKYLRAIYVPEDETCFYVFEAPSADLVVQASTLAGLGDGRIVEAFDGSAPHLGNAGACRAPSVDVVMHSTRPSR